MLNHKKSLQKFKRTKIRELQSIQRVGKVLKHLEMKKKKFLIITGSKKKSQKEFENILNAMKMET